MKLLISLFCMAIGGMLQAQDNFYDVSLVSSSGKVVNMSSYAGKKLLIVVTSPRILQAKTPAAYLGKIQASYPNVSVLILPFDNAADSASVIDWNLLPTVDNTLFGAQITNGKDSASENPMLRWLTTPTLNQHFEKTISSDEQYYVISESGVLYAVLDKGVSETFLKEVLTAPDVKPQNVITEINKQERSNPR